MKASQLQPASQLARRFGVKCLAYGPPGVGKTPLVTTAPSPVLLVTEPGMLSMRNATNVPAWEAFGSDGEPQPSRIDEFFDWLFRSNEAAQFQTAAIDSMSQLAEIYLKDYLKRNKDGRKAYGELSRKVMEFADGLYYKPNLHVYMIAKEVLEEDGNTPLRRPYFPGKDLNVKIPHLYDLICRVAEAPIPGQPKPVVAIRTKPTYGILARDRLGNLAEYEPPHLGNLFNKCMS